MRPDPVRPGVIPALVAAPWDATRDEREGRGNGLALFLACLPAMFVLVALAGVLIGTVIA